MAGNQNYETPPQFFEVIQARFNLTLDVCAEPHNAKCEAFYTLDDDGLYQPWHGRVWCNPPFSKARKWYEKALQERRNTEVIVMLTHACTSAGWFAPIYDQVNEMYQIAPRLSFLECIDGEKRTRGNNDRESLLTVVRPDLPWGAPVMKLLRWQAVDIQRFTTLLIPPPQLELVGGF